MTVSRRGFLGYGSLAIVGTTAALSGCSRDGDGEEHGSNEMVLEFPSWQADESGVSDWLRNRIAEFEDSNPNIRIDLQAVPYAQYADTLTSRFAAGTPPEIVHLPTATFGSYASQGWLEPLDDRLADTDILENWTAIQDTVRWDGKYQGVLLLGYAPVLYVNSAMLDSAGVAIPRSLDELIDAAARLNGAGLNGYTGTTSSHPGVYSELTWFVYGSGGAWSRGGELSVTEDTVVNAMQAYREVLSYAPQGVPAEQKHKLFFDGNAAVMLDGPYAYANLADSPENVRDAVDVVRSPFEQQPGFPSNSVHVPAGIAPERADAAWNFILHLTSPESQADYARLYHVPAPRRDVVTPDILEENPELELFQEVADEAIVATPDSEAIIGNFGEVQQLIIDAGVELLTTGTAASEIAAKLQDRIAAVTASA